MLGLRIRHLIAVGRGRQPARLDFVPGLNVIWGAANTGKSHILGLIDFALGASSPPDAPPEQQGYEGVMLGIETLDNKSWTFCRSLSGGDIRQLTGLRETWPDPNEGDVLAASHRPANSLSKFLLGELGMSDVRLRRNARGDTQDLSFRNLAHVVFVPEGKIQSELSPIETGQYVSKTVEYSLFKYMVTGVDDSSIQKVDIERRDRVRIAAQLELLDTQIADAEQSVKRITDDREELGERQERLDVAMDECLREWDSASGDYRALATERRELQRQQDAILDRRDEIDLLIDRFALLDAHYDSDIARLSAIEEASSIFATLDEGPCPWCGASAEHRGTETTIVCDGDVNAIRRAAKAEQTKIELKRVELAATVGRLDTESEHLENQLALVDARLSDLNRNIQIELPEVRVARARINDVITARDQTQSVLTRFENLERLRRLRLDIAGAGDVDSVSIIAEGGVDGTLLDDFAQCIERILVSWEFPAQRVFFDLARRDIQVSGKARRTNGKGVRAVLHAAFSLGLMNFTAQRNQPHPRILILDSPLVTYRDPLAPDEIALSRTNLNERFYAAFKKWNPDLQVIIIENRDPPQWIGDYAKVERFTGDTRFGRAGFYR